MNFLKHIVFVVSMLLLSSGTLAHEFYMSLTQINFNDKQRSLEISIKIFADDLERALIEKGMEPLFIGTEKEKPNSEEVILAYLQRRFKLEVNGTEVQYNWVGMEITNDFGAIWCYVEVLNVDAVKDISFYNRILTEAFDGQTNVVELLMPSGTKRYWHFDRSDFEAYYEP